MALLKLNEIYCVFLKNVKCGNMRIKVRNTSHGIKAAHTQLQDLKNRREILLKGL